jgi:hypothetical protein
MRVGIIVAVDRPILVDHGLARACQHASKLTVLKWRVRLSCGQADRESVAVFTHLRIVWASGFAREAIHDANPATGNRQAIRGILRGFSINTNLRRADDTVCQRDNGLSFQTTMSWMSIMPRRCRSEHRTQIPDGDELIPDNGGLEDVFARSACESGLRPLEQEISDETTVELSRVSIPIVPTIP